MRFAFLRRSLANERSCVSISLNRPLAVRLAYDFRLPVSRSRFDDERAFFAVPDRAFFVVPDRFFAMTSQVGWIRVARRLTLRPVLSEARHAQRERQAPKASRQCWPA